MMEKISSSLLFLPQMGLDDIKHLAEKLKKISQSLEVPPYFHISRWLTFSARWDSSFLCVIRSLQGSCRDGLGDRGDMPRYQCLSISCVPNPLFLSHLSPVEYKLSKHRDSYLLGGLLCPWSLETAPRGHFRAPMPGRMPTLP